MSKEAVPVAGVGDEMVKLVATMARLRGEGGCPWDREQTHESLRPYVLEEAYEVVDAIDRGDTEALREELGDLLLQVVFHAQLATEEGRFDLADIARELRLKLIRRHPHVFGEMEAEDSETVIRNWERIKQGEREREQDQEKIGPFATVPRAMPALMRAEKVMKRAAALGLIRSGPDEALQRVGEELEELRALLATETREQLQELRDKCAGELLIAAINLARLLGVDPERALARATDRLIDRLGGTQTQVQE